MSPATYLARMSSEFLFQFFFFLNLKHTSIVEGGGFFELILRFKKVVFQVYVKKDIRVCSFKN